MNFKYLHPPLPTPQIITTLTFPLLPPTLRSLLSLFFTYPIKFSCVVTPLVGLLLWYVSNLPVLTSLKKTDFPSPRRYQMPITSQLVLAFPSYCSPYAGTLSVFILLSSWTCCHNSCEFISATVPQYYFLHVFHVMNHVWLLQSPYPLLVCYL